LAFKGLNHANKRVEINLAGGQVFLDSSCTAGTVVLDGYGGSIVLNGATCTIESSNFISPASGSGAFTESDRTQLSTSATLATRLNAMLEDAGSYDRWLDTALEETPGGSGGGSLTAADVWTWTGGDRTLSGAQATNIAYIPSVKTKTDQLTFLSGDIIATLAGEEVTVSSTSVTAIVSGVDGALVIPTVVQVRQEMDSNSTKLSEIKSAAISAKNNAAAGL
jgi:hypothetical protein